ncbi:MAG: histidinol-phosphatase [Hyphococcus sp.]
MSLSSSDSETFRAFAMDLARAARQETLPRFRNDASVVDKVSKNAGFDPVTDADREGERVMRAMIAERFPDHGVIGEEFGAHNRDARWRWVLDPVDGTRAFICGMPTWTTLIALEQEGDPVLGVIDQPYTDDCWIAAGGETAFSRGGAVSVCRTSGVTDIAKVRLSTTDPRADSYFGEGPARAFSRLAGAARVARFSMDAYAYALLASGELDIVVETSLQHHDYAALKPVIEGAGGIITNWRGGAVGSDDSGETLAAATPELHAAAMALLRDS